MATTIIKTYQDAYEHLLDWNGSASADAVTLRHAKRAIDEAYYQICNARLWHYYMTVGRINTVASYDTGTVAYTHSTRTVTLTGGTFPSWAAQGVIQIDGIEYQVTERTSGSAIILSVNSNPGANVSSGTAYTIYRDTYTLPVDFTSMGTLFDVANGSILTKLEVNEWNLMRRNQLTADLPRYYCITQDPDYQGVLALRLNPPPDAIYVLDYPYRRKPRQLQVANYSTGTVATSTTTVTGTSTAWSSKMIGSVIRFSETSTTAPTGVSGDNPFVYERIITDVASATSLTIDSALTSELSGVKYTISDPIDLEHGAMYTAFLRATECFLAGALGKDNYVLCEKRRRDAEMLAREADNRSFDNPVSRPFDQLNSPFDLSGVQPT